MIATVTLNPALDKTVYVDQLAVNDANRVLRIEMDAGGKGINASRMLRVLGEETIALGFIGGDTGSFIEHVLHKEGVRTDFVEVSHPTRTNIQIQASDGTPPTVLNEKGAPVTENDLDRLCAKLETISRECSFVIFGGSVPLGVPVDVYERLILCAEANGAKAILDAENELLLEGMPATPFMIKPNRDEAERLVGKELESVEDITKAAIELKSRGVELVVLSMGKDGAVAVGNGGIFHSVPPMVNAVSTVGSGDSMVAGIASALSKGCTLEEALRLGSACGAATAMSSGVEMGCHQDIEKLLPQVIIRQVT